MVYEQICLRSVSAETAHILDENRIYQSLTKTVFSSVKCIRSYQYPNNHLSLCGLVYFGKLCNGIIVIDKVSSALMHIGFEYIVILVVTLTAYISDYKTALFW